MPKKKKDGAEKNRRLDLFLTQLQIEQEKKEKIIRYVEELTVQALMGKQQPKLRLKN